MSTIPRALLKVRYFAAAQNDLRQLRPVDCMETTSQAKQRSITLASLDLVHAWRADVQVFNDILVQYPVGQRKRPGQVVPDNMVVVHDQQIKADVSYDIPLQPVGPFLVLDYASKSSQRKDYRQSMDKYERDLKVPYYLLFVPEGPETTLYCHNGEKYISVRPNEQERLAIPELELELGLLGGWVRFWFRGELVPLPAELQNRLDQVEQQLRHAEQRATQAEEELARLRALLAQHGIQDKPGE